MAYEMNILSETQLTHDTLINIYINNKKVQNPPHCSGQYNTTTKDINSFSIGMMNKVNKI